jgi:hypothetical protein
VVHWRPYLLPQLVAQVQAAPRQVFIPPSASITSSPPTPAVPIDNEE